MVTQKLTHNQPTYADAARHYAESVVAGDILACRWVQRACQRQLDDLARYKGKASLYCFNPKLTDKQGRTFYPADNLCAFIERLPRSARQDSIPERRAWARKRIGQALDAVGGIASPGGCAVWHAAGMGRSIKEWSGVAGWNGRILNQYEAKGILVAAVGMLAVHYGYTTAPGRFAG